jgi:acyl-CoA dehydrogenase
MRSGSIENFFFDDFHFALGDEAAKFASGEAAAIRAKFEAGKANEDETARAFVAGLAKAGFLELCVPEDFGGRFAALDLRAICVLREKLAYESGFADCCFILQGLGGNPIALSGHDSLSKEWLPRVAKGTAIAGFAVTEPEAGSDLANVKTTAKRDGNRWVVNGTKIFISNAGVADFYTVLARTNDLPGHKGLSMLLVPANSTGVRVERMRVTGPHPIGTVTFDGARVPAEYLLSRDGEGMKLALSNLDFFRTSVGAAACGLARRALDAAIEHVKNRVQFGKPLAEQQLVRAMLADMAVELDAARLLVYRAAATVDRGSSRTPVPVSMAKLYATEAAQRIIDASLQLHGGKGVVANSTTERLYREIRALRIYEGTSEIQKLVIAKGLLE